MRHITYTSAMVMAIAAMICPPYSVQAWSVPNLPSGSHAVLPTNNNNHNNKEDHQATTNRRSVLNSFLQGGTAVVLATAGGVLSSPGPSYAVETLPSGVTYEVVKSGKGPQPELGELVAIRFAAYYGDRTIDDIYSTPEPYYTRLGSGGLLKGVETTLPLMKLGDRWKLTIPPDLAFGPKGRSASAGKPRIPGDATIVFDVEMVGLPGKEPELIELIGTTDE